MTKPASATKAWPALFHVTIPPDAKASHLTRTQRTDTFLSKSGKKTPLPYDSRTGSRRTWSCSTLSKMNAVHVWRSLCLVR
eukprot:3154208-Prymnesium_polylepis.1